MNNDTELFDNYPKESPKISITVGDIIDSEGIAIGPGARAEVHHHYATALALSDDERESLLSDYRALVEKQTRYVNLHGIPLPRDRTGQPMTLQIPLDHVYIRVQATTVDQRRVRDEAEQLSMLEREQDDKSKSGDFLTFIRTLGEYLYRRGEALQTEKRPDPIDPQAALEKHRRLVILGAPGSGKSTLLHYLALRATEATDGVLPIQVSLRDYATALTHDSALTIREFALRKASGGDQTMYQALESEIESGFVLWLLDALDETLNWATKVASQIAQLPGQLVITSRPVGYVNTGLDPANHFEILPLTTEDTDQFLRNWFSLLALQRQAGQEWIDLRVDWLKRQLQVRPRVRALAGNPLLLTFLTILSGEDPLQDLPDQRAELYGRYVRDLLHSWEAERRPKIGAEGKPALTLGPVEGDQARAIALQGFYYLGWALHLAYYGGQQNEVPVKDTVINALANYWREDWGKDAPVIAGQVLEFWEGAGLIDRWKLDQKEYIAFRHLTFQEYAAAWGVSQIWERDAQSAWNFLRPYLHHYAWREPILLLAGLMHQEHRDNLVSRLVRGASPYESSLHRDLRLTGEMLAEGVVLDEGDRVLRRLVWMGKYHFYELTPTIVVSYTLILCGLIVGHFHPCLTFGSLMITGIVLFWYFAFHSFVARGIITYPARIWRSFPDRTVVTELLGRIGTPAMPHLLEALHSKDIFVRISAIEALGRIGVPEVIPYLTEASTWWNSSISNAANKALRQIEYKQSRSHLFKAMQDGLRGAYHSTFRSLMGMNDAQVFPYLIEALKNVSSEVRETVAIVLGDMRDTKAYMHLVLALHDKVDYVRQSAAAALGQICDERAFHPLINALLDEDSGVRASAVWALGQLGNQHAYPDLIPILEDESPSLRSHAAEALGKLRAIHAIDQLIRALQDDDASVRSSAVWALGQCGDVQTVQHLRRAFEDSNSDVRLAVAKALDQIHHDGYLIKALKDKAEYVRGGAAIALGQIGDPETIPHLITALRDKDSKVRASVAEALGMYADKLNDIKLGKQIARVLWWSQTDFDIGAVVFRSLDQIANRLSVLEVEQMPLVDPLLPKPSRAKKR